MTQNQIAFWNFNETRRHNKVTEGETKRHNVATESLEKQHIELGWAQLSEQTRSNRANELLKSQANQETSRHNKAYESETNRHNLSTESYTQEHYYSMDQETHRSNLMREWYQDRSIMLDQANLDLQESRLDWEKTSGTHNIIQGYIDEFSDLVRSGASLKDAQTRESKANWDILAGVTDRFDDIVDILSFVSLLG